MKENKQHHENHIESRWINTDVLSSFLFLLTYTDHWTEEEKTEREKKGELEKNAEARQLSK